MPARRIEGLRARGFRENDWRLRRTYPATIDVDPSGVTYTATEGGRGAFYQPFKPRIRTARWDDVKKITLRHTAVGPYLNIHVHNGLPIRLRVTDLAAAAAAIRAVAPSTVAIIEQPTRGPGTRFAIAVTLVVVIVMVVFGVAVVASHAAGH